MCEGLGSVPNAAETAPHLCCLEMLSPLCCHAQDELLLVIAEWVGGLEGGDVGGGSISICRLLNG